MKTKIFNFINSAADKLARKDLIKLFNNNKNKIIIIGLILFATITGVLTYNLGECTNCDNITREEVTEMLEKFGDNDMDFVSLYETKSYAPFTSIGPFIKSFLPAFLFPIMLMCMFYFLVHFIFRLTKNLILNRININKKQFKNGK